MYYCIAEENDKYMIHMTNNFYNYMQQFYRGGSYYNVMFRLYGLSPYDFYHYIGAKFNAKYRKNPFLQRHVDMFFETKKDAEAFREDLNSRFSYCIEEKFFEVN